jgi:hypothetical protein
MKTNAHFLSYLTHLFLEWGMFQTKFVEKNKTHTLRLVTFLSKKSRLWDNVEKYCTAGQSTGKNKAHCMLDTQGYKHTLRICNT